MSKICNLFSKYLTVILLMAFTINSYGQFNCKCIRIKKECINYCLGSSNDPLIVQKRFNLDPKTAKEIVKVPNRGSFKNIADYKGKISSESYRKLSIVYQDINSRTTNIDNSGSTNNGIIAGRDVIVNMHQEVKPSDPEKQKIEHLKPSVNKMTVLPAIDTFSEIKTTVQKCVYRNNRLICYLLFEYVGNSDKLQIILKKEDTAIIVDGGVTFRNSRWTIANLSTHPWYVNYTLLSGVPVEASVEFEVGMNVTTIYKLPIVGDSGFRNLPVSSQ